MDKAKLLEETLESFKVSAKVIEVHPGPVITRFELEPAPGVKVNKIVSLSDDIALALRATRVRIIAPIPGKAAVGVEIPNQKAATVYMKAIINSEKFAASDSPLTIALGKTSSGEIICVDLATMPHLLIAGSTGSGMVDFQWQKNGSTNQVYSVFINHGDTVFNIDGADNR